MYSRTFKTEEEAIEAWNKRQDLESNWVSCDDSIPKEDNKYILGWDGDYRIVKIEHGLSKEEREKMKSGELEDPYVGGWSCSGYSECHRSSAYEFCDEDGNNLVPYAWSTNNGHNIFGKDIKFWKSLPDPPVDKKDV